MNEPKPEPVKKERDVNVDQVEKRLQSRFGTKVKIDEKQIVIKYHGNDDLNRVLEMIVGLDDEM